MMSGISLALTKGKRKFEGEIVRQWFFWIAASCLIVGCARPRSTSSVPVEKSSSSSAQDSDSLLDQFSIDEEFKEDIKEEAQEFASAIGDAVSDFDADEFMDEVRQLASGLNGEINNFLPNAWNTFFGGANSGTLQGLVDQASGFMGQIEDLQDFIDNGLDQVQDNDKLQELDFELEGIVDNLVFAYDSVDYLRQWITKPQSSKPQ